MKNLETIWSKAAALGQTLKEYPRPDMVRRHWINLNGMWDYLITDSRILPWQFYESEYFPFDGQILVPFSPEAPLSQVKRQLLPDETLMVFPYHPVARELLRYRKSAASSAFWSCRSDLQCVH